MRLTIVQGTDEIQNLYVGRRIPGLRRAARRRPNHSFENVSLLGLRTATVLDNCKPMVRDIVKVRFIATNCGESRLEIVPACQDGRVREHRHSEQNSITLLPGGSTEYSVFRSWDTPGQHVLTLAYEARSAGQPFARLSYPKVTIHSKLPEASKLMHWISRVRAAHLQASVSSA